MIHNDLIFDLGFHNGDDTAYYLERRYRVLAVDANPAVVEAGSRRFESAITEGRLILRNVGIAESVATLNFYINEADSKLSSFDRSLAARHGDPCREIPVPCITLLNLFQEHGVPHYLKVDLEGYDELCARALIGATELPPFVSLELFMGDDVSILESLRAAGYSRFKLIHGVSFTQSEPIFQHETSARILRKLSRRLPGFKRLLQASPGWLRPQKDEFDSFREKLEYAFPEGCTGPFADDTPGPWRSYDAIRIKADSLKKKLQRDPTQSLWYDVHAAL